MSSYVRSLQTLNHATHDAPQTGTFPGPRNGPLTALPRGSTRSVQEALVKKQDKDKRVVVQLKSIADMTEEEIEVYAGEIWKKLAEAHRPGSTSKQ